MCACYCARGYVPHAPGIAPKRPSRHHRWRAKMCEWRCQHYGIVRAHCRTQTRNATHRFDCAIAIVCRVATAAAACCSSSSSSAAHPLGSVCVYVGRSSSLWRNNITLPLNGWATIIHTQTLECVVVSLPLTDFENRTQLDGSRNRVDAFR